MTITQREQLTGGCLCGAVRYELAEPPAAQMICHCIHCQKQSGSAFSTIIGVPEGQVRVSGAPASYTDSGESGKSVERQFCGQCGSPLFSIVELAPGMVWIKAGTLDNAADFAPSAHIYTKSKQHWVDTGDLPAFETNPQ